MRIAVVSTYYSAGMGYTENCLPKALAALGHEVRVVASNWNVYGTSAEYDETYGAFLGPADQGTGQWVYDGYTVERVRSRLVRGYVALTGLRSAIRAFRPHVVHSIEVASLQTFQLAALRLVDNFRLFAETHQHLSVVRPFLKERGGSVLPKLSYWATRTVPTSLSSRFIERCYAISPDCAEVASRFYGVPESKLVVRSLGTDTDHFRPTATANDRVKVVELRRAAGIGDGDIVCLYTGRFSNDKNPIVLARAIDLLSASDCRFRGVFVGAGNQRDAILACSGTSVLPFQSYQRLADIYRMADIAVWPRLESMSMLDAAASGLPLVVSAEMGESLRVAGNGLTFREDDPASLAAQLLALASPNERQRLGALGREKMEHHFSWRAIAQSTVADYLAAGVRA